MNPSSTDDDKGQAVAPARARGILPLLLWLGYLAAAASPAADPVRVLLVTG